MPHLTSGGYRSAPASRGDAHHQPVLPPEALPGPSKPPYPRSHGLGRAARSGVLPTDDPVIPAAVGRRPSPEVTNLEECVD